MAICLYYFDCRICLNNVFRSDPFITPSRNYTNFKKNFLNRSFLKSMVGTFCATCTVTGYSRLICNVFLKIYMRQQIFCALISYETTLVCERMRLKLNQFIGRTPPNKPHYAIFKQNVLRPRKFPQNDDLLSYRQSTQNGYPKKVETFQKKNTQSKLFDEVTAAKAFHQLIN